VPSRVTLTCARVKHVLETSLEPGSVGPLVLEGRGARWHLERGSGSLDTGVRPSNYQNVQVVAPMAGAGVCASSSLRSSLVMGGMQDSIVAYSSQQSGFDTTPTPKRLVGLKDAGHMAFTAFCPIGKDRGGILQAAMNAGVMFDPSFISLVGPLAADGCGPNNLAAERGWQVIDFATAGAFEEILFCLPERAAELSRIPDLFPDAVGDFHEEL